MSLEIVRPGRGHRGHRPRPLPHRRFFGGGYPYPVYQEPIILEVERSSLPLPWRVTQYNSWGESVLFQSASMADALKFYKDKSRNWKSTTVGFNVNLNLQHWTGSGWKTEASMNSQDWLQKKAR